MEGGFAGSFDAAGGQELFPPGGAGHVGVGEDVGEPASVRTGATSAVGKVLSGGAKEDAVKGNDAELDEGEGDGVSEAGEDVFAGVVADGGGGVPEDAEAAVAEHAGCGYEFFEPTTTGLVVVVVGVEGKD